MYKQDDGEILTGNIEEKSEEHILVIGKTE